ncbi:metallophosphoesterase [Terrarubrum flagellatum]|uniref:metallophosphoesterase family protein n=1 Tax=Terrirubrum flagellatum TaxID=2895980 RepID=UPI00314534DD
MNERPFRIAFFSDPHIGPIPRVSLSALMGKRITGLINWRLTRKARYDMAALNRIVADILAAKPDHVICGGDVSNIGLREEFIAGRKLLERFGDPQRVSFVPGNHSAYVPDSVAPLREIFAPWMTGDCDQTPEFPYLRKRAGVAIIGLNSAVPRPPFDASGMLGETQIEAAFLMLTALKSQGLCRIIVIHHPPYVGGAPRDRALRDAAEFEEMLSQAGAELVLHGHNHRTSVAHRKGGDAMVPIVGVGSSSERNPARGRKPVWLSIETVRNESGAWEITITERGMEASGEVTERPLNLAI